MPDAPPPRAHYTRLARERGLVSGGGKPLSFVAPDPGLPDYELRIFERGEVPTREGDWHDACNAEAWLEFPLAKAAANRLHVAAIRESQPSRDGGKPPRGALRDRLTQFDECGVVVAGMRMELWEALRAHRWREVFVAHRAEVVATSRFLIFGHGSRDALRAPFFGLCGKALRLDAPAGDPAAIDAELARRLARADFCTTYLQPLPLLGIPGLCAANEDPAYYDDIRQFRPPRTMCAGSPLGSR